MPQSLGLAGDNVLLFTAVVKYIHHRRPENIANYFQGWHLSGLTMIMNRKTMDSCVPYLMTEAQNARNSDNDNQIQIYTPAMLALRAQLGAARTSASTVVPPMQELRMDAAIGSGACCSKGEDAMNLCECILDDSGFYLCTQPAVCCPMPSCSVPKGTLTDTCLEHMDERKIDGRWVKMCQECCDAFDNPQVVQ